MQALGAGTTMAGLQLRPSSLQQLGRGARAACAGRSRRALAVSAVAAPQETMYSGSLIAPPAAGHHFLHIDDFTKPQLGEWAPRDPAPPARDLGGWRVAGGRGVQGLGGGGTGGGGDGEVAPLQFARARRATCCCCCSQPLLRLLLHLLLVQRRC